MSLKKQIADLMDSVAQKETNKMNVNVETVVAIKPNILRVKLYTHDEEHPEKGVIDYEIALLTNDFTTQTSEGTVEIDIDNFKKLVTKQLTEMQNTANLAKAIEAADLYWEIAFSDTNKEEEESPEGLKLAFGEEE